MMMVMHQGQYMSYMQQRMVRLARLTPAPTTAMRGQSTLFFARKAVTDMVKWLVEIKVEV